MRDLATHDGIREAGREEGWEADGGKTFRGIVVNRDSARRDLRAFLVGDVAEDYITRQAVSDLEGCHLASLISFAMWVGVN